MSEPNVAECILGVIANLEFHRDRATCEADELRAVNIELTAERDTLLAENIHLLEERAKWDQTRLRFRRAIDGHFNWLRRGSEEADAGYKLAMNNAFDDLHERLETEELEMADGGTEET